ncbi:unnamed protein product [Soboliphyme baturini]|uniref:Reverse transcriptase domain-containing protein n=1 Tax=Soboliphyme baturini TaxID=241478 RepID=A0A183IS97_9BILA|nr:unnamed protein product [Soboliphyme baturini]
MSPTSLGCVSLQRALEISLKRRQYNRVYKQPPTRFYVYADTLAIPAAPDFIAEYLVVATGHRFHMLASPAIDCYTGSEARLPNVVSRSPGNGITSLKITTSLGAEATNCTAFSTQFESRIRLGRHVNAHGRVLRIMRASNHLYLPIAMIEGQHIAFGTERSRIKDYVFLSANHVVGITLLSLPGKVYAKVLETRCREIVGIKVQEEHCGFRAGRSASDHIFVLRQIVEKSWENAQPVYMCFVDLEKAHNRIPRNSPWTCLRACGTDGQLLRAIQSLYSDSRCSVIVNGIKSKPFNVRTGLRQGSLRLVSYPVCVVQG